MPASRHRSRSPCIGRRGHRDDRRTAPRPARPARMPRAAAYPSMPGIWMSMRTASKSPAAASRHRVVAVVDDVGGVAERLEQPEGDQLVDLVVLDHEHRAAGLGCVRGRGRWRGGVDADRLGRCPRRPRSTVNQNREPSPGALCTPMRPPMAATSWWQIARPRPVPPKVRVVDASACRNGSKRCWPDLGGDADAGVADLDLAAVTRSVERGLQAGARSSTRPSWVNFTALDTRLRHDLAEPRRVADQHARDRGSGDVTDLELLVAGDAREDRQGLLEDAAEVELDRLELQLAGLDLGEVQDVVDDARAGCVPRSARRWPAAAGSRRARCAAAGR